MSGGESLASAVRASVEHLGYRRTLLRVLYRAANTGLGFSLLQCIRVSVDRFPRAALLPDSPLEFRFLEPDEIERFAADSGNHMTPAFVAGALAKGDECFAGLDAGRLACQGWYSRRPTVVEDGVEVHFDPKRVLMYHGFAHPAYRGRHIHAAGIGRALEEYTRRGAPGLVSLYSVTNYSAARTIDRMGWEPCGLLYRVGSGRLAFAGATRECASVGFRMAR